MTEQSKERRSHPRISAEISGHIVCHTTKGALQMTTRNISCSGLYCHVSEYIAPFTRVDIEMNLPLHQSGKAQHRAVRFEGVVVRAEPGHAHPSRTEFNVAIFFSGITPRAKSLVARYVREHTEQKS